ncbi:MULTISPECIES: SRPBCC domain-containing protein [unclassified Kribbella]|uniref:SRPBCC domain-containing protein n=1 Tax=unclassified Kribbella TaxID=2644121 RepID=UPI00301AD72C
MADYLATAETDIKASPERVWDVLTDPDEIKKFMFGADVKTDWKQGSPITWSGEYEGKEYEDKGEILEIDPGRMLRVTHYSPLSGQPDVPENYHTLTYSLDGNGTSTHLKLTQDNNNSEEEAEHSKGMWEMLVTKVKEAAEK